MRSEGAYRMDGVRSRTKYGTARAAAPVEADRKEEIEKRTPRLTPARTALLILAVAAAFTLYIGHVHATQELLSEVQTAQREHLRLNLKYNRLKGEFDRATGPAMIYERARALGLEEGIAYGPELRYE